MTFEKGIWSVFQHFAAVVYLNKTVNDLCKNLEIQFFS